MAVKELRPVELKDNVRIRFKCRAFLMAEMCVCREGKVHASILIGEVVMMHASEGVMGQDEKGRPCIETEQLAPVSRLGNPRYGLTVATIDMEMIKHETLT